MAKIENRGDQSPRNMGGPTLDAPLKKTIRSDLIDDPDMDSNEEPAHLSGQAADPGEFKASNLESKRPLSDGRDD